MPMDEPLKENPSTPGLKNCKQLYMELMVSDKFEGIGGKWYPVYIPVLVPEEVIPEFELIQSRGRHALLLTDEGFQATINLWNRGMVKTITENNKLITKENSDETDIL